MNRADICIIGYGIAGQLLLLELLQRGKSRKNIIVIDENFLGGALVTKYGSVMSNTPWWKTKNAMKEYLEWSRDTIGKYDEKYNEKDCMPVRDIGKVCLEVANYASYGVKKICGKVTSISSDENGEWKIKYTTGIISCKKVFFAHGAEEKVLDIPIPIIPLHLALDKSSLEAIIKKGEDSVVMFGTSHSGTIVLKHLEDLGIETVAIYNTVKPFLFERDGEYDGLKEGSATIADEILEGKYKNIELVSMNNSIEVCKRLAKCTKVIYCIGFEVREIGNLSFDYDAVSAKLRAYKNAWGYGIGFPGITEIDKKVYKDVSVLSFQQQIRNTLKEILAQE